MYVFMWILAGLLLALQALDAATTYKIISNKKGHEANNVMAWIMGKMGLGPALMITKFAAVVAILAIAQYAPFLASIPIFIIADAGYGWVVYKNVLIMNM